MKAAVDGPIKPGTVLKAGSWPAWVSLTAGVITSLHQVIMGLFHKTEAVSSTMFVKSRRDENLTWNLAFRTCPGAGPCRCPPEVIIGDQTSVIL